MDEKAALTRLLSGDARQPGWFPKGLVSSSLWRTVFCARHHTELPEVSDWQVRYVTEELKTSSSYNPHALCVMGRRQNLGGLFLLPSDTPWRGSWTEVIITWHQQWIIKREQFVHSDLVLWKDFCEKAALWISSSAECRSLLLPAVGPQHRERKHYYFCIT